MISLAKVFEVQRRGIKPVRGLIVLAAMVVPLVILEAAGLQQFWLSLVFGMLFVALSDPGGTYRRRLRAMGAVALIGTAITALGFAIGGGPWVIVVLVSFVVTLAAGLSVRYGRHGFVAGLMLASWFLVTVSEAASRAATTTTPDWWQQALAWALGSGIWVLITVGFWLARGRKAQDSHFPELPVDTTSMTLTRPVVLFAVIQALAVSISVAIAFGLHLPDADWMPIATLVAMKTSLNQAALASVQRIVGAVIGALLAMLVLLTVDARYALEAIILILGAFAASFRGANYALYCAAVAGLVLIATDINQPQNLSAEGRRVLFTLLGLAIGLAVLLIGGAIQKRTARVGAPPAAPKTV